MNKLKTFLIAFFMFSICSFSGIGVHAATIGQQLLTPELGWYRYDDSTFTYSTSPGSWGVSSTSSAYNGSFHYITTSGSPFYTFTFNGVGFRIIERTTSGGGPNVQVNVDGVNYYYSERLTDATTYQVLTFELRGLTSGNHTVKVSNNILNADAVDIEQPPPLGVVGVTPPNNSINNELDTDVILTFNASLKTKGNITLKKHSDNSNVSFNISMASNAITIIPTSKFDYDTQYDVSVSNTTDVSDRVLPSNFTSTFTTKKDTVPPQVLTIKPPPDSIDVPLDQIVEITFSKNIDVSSLSKVNVSFNSTNIGINKVVNANVLNISFTQLLQNNKTYNLHIESVKDMLGNVMPNPVDVKFSTVKPQTLTLLTYKPPSGSVPLSQDIKLTFDNNVDPKSISFSLKDEKNNTVSSTLKVIGKDVTILPVLQSGHTYTFSNFKASTVGGDIQSFDLALTLNVIVSTGNKNIDNLLSQNVSLFTDLHSLALNIILSAIGLLIIFIGGKWLYKKLKIWLHKA